MSYLNKLSMWHMAKHWRPILSTDTVDRRF